VTYIYEVDLPEVISKLPDITPMQIERDFSSGRNDDLFLCALGFEDRCTSIPRMIAENGKYKCHESIHFEYSTNPEDNEINRTELVAALKNFSTLVTPLPCDNEGFAAEFRQVILRSCQRYGCPKITFDISVCASRLILLVMKILFEFDVDLRIVYSEANIYHPTRKEIEQDREIGKTETNEEKLNLAKGVSIVSPSNEHPGSNIDSLPEAIVSFATFSPRRSEAIIAYIDENLLAKPGERVTWIVGIPHLKEDSWRINYAAEISDVPRSQSINVSTFDYKDMIKNLNKLHRQYSMKYHLNVSALGSKMQSLGIALFHYMQPEVTIMFAPPVKYNASRYSEGCKKTWVIDFGRIDKIRDILDELGIVKLKQK
jgi:hypothetical protein